MLSLSFANSLSDIDKVQWNSLYLYYGENQLIPLKQADSTDYQYPFLAYEFLQLLEQSGACSRDSGWQPQHILFHRDGTLVAAIPAYLKYHSYGEYMFDWAWAEAYERHQMNYYPKLVCAVPFTPCTGPRLLFDAGISDAEKHAVFTQIASIIEQPMTEEPISSVHFLYLPEAVSTTLNRDYGIPQRLSYQYHWFNRDYDSFDDFLKQLKSRKRKAIRKERKAIAQQGIAIRKVTAKESVEQDWQKISEFYRHTYLKRSGHTGYLPKNFFLQLAQAIPDNTLLFFAEYNGETVAASLFFTSPTQLFGRYWGCKQEFDHLHFELCYYQGIEYCIEHGIAEFDAGAQGEHKIQRGFEAIPCFGNAVIRHPDFAEAIVKFLQHESIAVCEHIKATNEQLPFAKTS